MTAEILQFETGRPVEQVDQDEALVVDVLDRRLSSSLPPEGSCPRAAPVDLRAILPEEKRLWARRIAALVSVGS